METTCTHPMTVTVDARVSYGDVFVFMVSDGANIPVFPPEDDTEDEEVNFPPIVENLGVSNNGNGLAVDVNLTICVHCRKVL